MAVRWLEKGYIHTGGVACGTPEVRLLNMSKSLNIQILKSVFKSTVIPLDRKTFLLERILGEQKNDIADNARFYLNATLPDAKWKEITWNEMIDEKSKLPLSKRK